MNIQLNLTQLTFELVPWHPRRGQGAAGSAVQQFTWQTMTSMESK